MTIEEAIHYFEDVSKCNSKLARESAELALSALRAQQEAEKKEPLTIDELRQMNGQPVWVQSPGIQEYGRWGIVEGVSEDGRALFLKDDFTCHNYGLIWIAYRHPPKEAHND